MNDRVVGESGGMEMNMEITTRKLQVTRDDCRPTNRTMTVSWSKYPQRVHESRTVELEGEVTLTIDVEALIKDLGVKALKSKGRKAVECSGAVVVMAKITSSKAGEWK